MSKVLQKRHMEDVRKCCLALGDPREHERSGLQLGTRAGNNFFHFLAENIILQSGKASKALATAQGGNHSSVEGGKGSYQKRKAITYTSKINIKIPATCLYQNGGLSLLYTNTKSGCLELRTRVGKTTVTKHMNACDPAILLASRQEHSNEEGSVVAAVLKTQNAWNTSESRPVAKREVYQLLEELDPKKKKKKSRKVCSIETEVEKVIQGMLKSVVAANESQHCHIRGGKKDQETFEVEAAEAESKPCCWSRDVLLQEYIPCKSMCNTLYRVVWRSASSRQNSQVPSKVWKVSSLLNIQQQPLVDMCCAKTCSVQDVSGRPFVSGAVTITSSFARHMNLLVKKKIKGGRVVELVADFVLGEDKVWHMLQVKAFKCTKNDEKDQINGTRINMKNDLSIEGVQAAPRATRARPQSAQPLAYHKRTSKGLKQAKCCGDYCGALRARENQHAFGDGHGAEALDLAESRRQRKTLIIKPFAENFKVGNSLLNEHSRNLNDFIVCDNNEPQTQQDVMFKIPYKLIHNDRSNVYEKSDTQVKWMFRGEYPDERSSLFGALEHEWEVFEETESMLIEEAFQKGCKFFRLSDATSISFVEEKMEHVAEMQAHLGRDTHTHTHTVMYDIKRHPPFVTQQYIVHRRNDSRTTTENNTITNLCPEEPIGRLSRDTSASSCFNDESSYLSPVSGEKGTGRQKVSQTKGKLYDMVSVCRDCYRVYLCKEHMKLQVMVRD